VETLGSAHNSATAPPILQLYQRKLPGGNALRM
jgi:hypothetical protein